MRPRAAGREQQPPPSTFATIISIFFVFFIIRSHFGSRGAVPLASQGGGAPRCVGPSPQARAPRGLQAAPRGPHALRPRVRTCALGAAQLAAHGHEPWLVSRLPKRHEPWLVHFHPNAGLPTAVGGAPPCLDQCHLVDNRGCTLAGRTCEVFFFGIKLATAITVGVICAQGAASRQSSTSSSSNAGVPLRAGGTSWFDQCHLCGVSGLVYPVWSDHRGYPLQRCACHGIPFHCALGRHEPWLVSRLPNAGLTSAILRAGCCFVGLLPAAL